MEGVHGGDIYRNQVKVDFSVNINPLGIPDEVEEALYKAVKDCDKYPDISAEKLKTAVSEMINVPKENLLFGNGASELFMGIIHSIRPKKMVIPVPSFYGYEYAAETMGGEILYYKTKEEKDFVLQEDFLSALTEEMEVIFLANPNNPTGNLYQREFLRKLLMHCQDKGIYVVLDECFIDFCKKEYSMLGEIKEFSNLIIVRAFTKIFSIPGVRLGYIVSGNLLLLEKIKRELPEWNISCFAQAAGVAGASQQLFIEKTAAYVKKEREFLKRGLINAGFKVFPTEAVFLLIYCEYPLYDKLLEKGILIRDCKNFRGLTQGFYRIAVKSRKENEELLKAIGEIKWN